MKNRPKLNFDDMGIPNGAKLVSVETGETVKVSGHKRVVVRDETMGNYIQGDPNGPPVAWTDGRPSPQPQGDTEDH